MEEYRYYCLNKHNFNDIGISIPQEGLLTVEMFNEPVYMEMVIYRARLNEYTQESREVFFTTTYSRPLDDYEKQKYGLYAVNDVIVDKRVNDD